MGEREQITIRLTPNVTNSQNYAEKGGILCV